MLRTRASLPVVVVVPPPLRPACHKACRSKPTTTSHAGRNVVAGTAVAAYLTHSSKENGLNEITGGCHEVPSILRFDWFAETFELLENFDEVRLLSSAVRLLHTHTRSYTVAHFQSWKIITDDLPIYEQRYEHCKRLS